MLKEIPSCCPLCKSDWIKTDNPNTFVCPFNYECRIALLIADGAHYYLRKRLDDGGEIWWTSVGDCEFRWRNSGYSKINFDPPYNITAERLKLLIVFS